MKRNFGKLSVMFSALAAAAIGVGCGGGGGTNNDQGVAVQFLGFFQEFGQGCDTLPGGLTGVVFPLGSASPEPLEPDGNAGEISTSSIVAVLGLQNNLFKQYFRADRLIYDYFIPGATAQPPSSNAPFSVFVGPPEDVAGGSVRRPVSGALPPTYTGTCNRAFSQMVIVPPSVREWLNFNRDSLPEPPFQMEITVRIGGMSSSGNYYTTNAETLYAEVSPETLVTPPEGSGGSDEDDSGGLGLTGDESTVPSDDTLDEGGVTDGTTDDDTGLDGLGDAIPDDGGDSTGSGDL